MSTFTSLPVSHAASSGQVNVAVEISDTQGFLKVDRARLVHLIESVLGDEGVDEAAISLALVDNPTIRRINRKHLAHDWPTDVISFLLSAPDDTELVGELIVSAEMAVTTAGDLAADATAELALYVVHGLLHLCGYDDSTETDIHEIRAREQVHLTRYLLSCAKRVMESPRPGRQEEELASWSG